MSESRDTQFAHVADIPLVSLAQLDDTVLAHSLRRLRYEIEHPEEAIAGFQNRM
jgi:FXSXX-COOH protein